MKFLSDIRLLLLGLWLGAAVFFIAVAQGAFAVLPQRELAGAVVNRTLTVLNYGGLAMSIILLLTSLLIRKGTNRILLWAERFLLLLIAAACAVGQFVIGLWMSMLRAEMGGRPIDEIAPDDPLRIKFNTLHESSVWVLVAGMAAALIAFFIISNRKFGPAAVKDPNAPYDFSKEFKV